MGVGKVVALTTRVQTIEEGSQDNLEECREALKKADRMCESLSARVNACDEATQGMNVTVSDLKQLIAKYGKSLKAITDILNEDDNVQKLQRSLEECEGKLKDLSERIQDDLGEPGDIHGKFKGIEERFASIQERLESAVSKSGQ